MTIKKEQIDSFYATLHLVNVLADYVARWRSAISTEYLNDIQILSQSDYEFTTHRFLLNIQRVRDSLEKMKSTLDPGSIRQQVTGAPSINASQGDRSYLGYVDQSERWREIYSKVYDSAFHNAPIVHTPSGEDPDVYVAKIDEIINKMKIEVKGLGNLYAKDAFNTDFRNLNTSWEKLKRSK